MRPKEILTTASVLTFTTMELFSAGQGKAQPNLQSNLDFTPTPILTPSPTPVELTPTPEVNPPDSDIQKTIDAQNKEVEKQPAIAKKMGFYSSFLGQNFLESTQNIENTAGEIPLTYYGAFLDRIRYAMWLTYFHADQPAPYGLGPDDFQNNAYRGKNGFSPDGNSSQPVIPFEDFVKQAQEGKKFEVWVPDYTNGTRNFEDGREVKWKKINLMETDLDIKLDAAWKKGLQPVSTNSSTASRFYMTETSKDGKQIVTIIYNPGIRDYGKYKDAKINFALSEIFSYLVSPQTLIRSFGDGPNDPITAKIDQEFKNQLQLSIYDEMIKDPAKKQEMFQTILNALQYTTKPVSTVLNENASPITNLNVPDLSDARAMFLSNKPSRKDLKNL